MTELIKASAENPWAALAVLTYNLVWMVLVVAVVGETVKNVLVAYCAAQATKSQMLADRAGDVARGFRS